MGILERNAQQRFSHDLSCAAIVERRETLTRHCHCHYRRRRLVFACGRGKAAGKTLIIWVRNALHGLADFDHSVRKGLRGLADFDHSVRKVLRG